MQAVRSENSRRQRHWRPPIVRVSARSVQDIPGRGLIDQVPPNSARVCVRHSRSTATRNGRNSRWRSHHGRNQIAAISPKLTFGAVLGNGVSPRRPSSRRGTPINMILNWRYQGPAIRFFLAAGSRLNFEEEGIAVTNGPSGSPVPGRCGDQVAGGAL